MRLRIVWVVSAWAAKTQCDRSRYKIYINYPTHAVASGLIDVIVCFHGIALHLIGTALPEHFISEYTGHYCPSKLFFQMDVHLQIDQNRERDLPEVTPSLCDELEDVPSLRVQV